MKIVDQLRNAAKEALAIAPTLIEKSLYWRAADEIEQLRARIAELEQQLRAAVPGAVWEDGSVSLIRHGTEDERCRQRGALRLYTAPPPPAVPASKVPDDIRVALDSARADIGYLFGRVAADSSFSAAAQAALKARLDAVATWIYSAPPPVASNGVIVPAQMIADHVQDLEMCAEAFDDCPELKESAAGCRKAAAEFRGMLAQAVPAGGVVLEQSADDRSMLRYLMQQFDAETWQCPKCGHAEDTATMDSAIELRKYLSAQQQPEQILSGPLHVIGDGQMPDKLRERIRKGQQQEKPE